MKTQLYILGLLLRCGPQHGYMLKQTIEDQVSDFSQIKLPTIYYHLEKLHEKGYISAELQKDSNRPERTVYSITENGEVYFYSLLKKLQAEEFHLEFPIDGLIFFQENVDRREYADYINNAADSLDTKLKNVVAHRDKVMDLIPDAAKTSAKAIFNHHIYHLRAELEWFKELQKGL